METEEERRERDGCVWGGGCGGGGGCSINLQTPFLSFPPLQVIPACKSMLTGQIGCH